MGMGLGRLPPGACLRGGALAAALQPGAYLQVAVLVEGARWVSALLPARVRNWSLGLDVATGAYLKSSQRTTTRQKRGRSSLILCSKQTASSLTLVSHSQQCDRMVHNRSSCTCLYTDNNTQNIQQRPLACKFAFSISLSRFILRASCLDSSP